MAREPITPGTRPPRPSDEKIVRKFNEIGSVTGVATFYGISSSVMGKWLRAAGVDTTYRPRLTYKRRSRMKREDT